MSFLAWIDFDQADRDRARRIMDLFGTEDARDELGLGGIRDALSDLMFPGTSVIQTRLRYMLFVPWIFRMAAGRPGGAVLRADHARGLELRLIDALIAGGETTGVIGSEARERLKRLPSDVYWAGLQAWQIRTEPGNRADYLALPPEMSPWAVGLPEAPTDLLERADFRLTRDEADFLKDRLTVTAPGSLLTQLALAGDRTRAEAVWLHPGRPDWSDWNRRITAHAESFSRVMHGAALLYNLMLAERAASLQGLEGSRWHDLAAGYRQSLADWREDLRTLAVAEWSLDSLWVMAQSTAHRIAPQTMRFVTAWHELVLETGAAVADDSAARALIEDRELRLKGPKARLKNDSALARWSGASGTQMLGYRWGTVASHLRDLADAR